ncbi:hypothetical protein F8388_008696 [Cannabis sativa]|uniref:Diacylglycerol kinase accessory domain-containing protein n=1 Tax=Cannabis sativa TaxID=3483 RepID=A0A7J6HK19_CANSA|nr:hypothetical protein F8388_008696 [Cannabis sativa]
MKEGYKFWDNVGNQWSDLQGESLGNHKDAEGVLVANIGSYMGGVDLWQNEDENYDNFDLQSIHDKILEVVSISGTWHLGKLQVGLSRAPRLAQGQSIKIQLFAAFPVQIDGEPWFHQSCTLAISHHGQLVFVLDDLNVLPEISCEMRSGLTSDPATTKSSSAGSFTPRSPLLTPRTSRVELLLNGRKIMSKLESTQQIFKLLDIARSVANINNCEYSALQYMLERLEYLKYIIQDRKMDALVIETFGRCIEKLLHLLSFIIPIGLDGFRSVGLSRAPRLAQGQSIKIQLLAAFPVQIDGEPWFQQSCTLAISHHGQSVDLFHFEKNGYYWFLS